MARPITTDDDRPICLVPECPAPCDLSCRYVKGDGTVKSSYRRWCSWHARHPHASPNPYFFPDPEIPRCQVPECGRKARRLIHRPRVSASSERAFIYGNEAESDGYARVCTRHALKDLPTKADPLPKALRRRAPRKR